MTDVAAPGRELAVGPQSTLRCFTCGAAPNRVVIRDFADRELPFLACQDHHGQDDSHCRPFKVISGNVLYLDESGRFPLTAPILQSGNLDSFHADEVDSRADDYQLVLEARNELAAPSYWRYVIVVDRQRGEADYIESHNDDHMLAIRQMAEEIQEAWYDKGSTAGHFNIAARIAGNDWDQYGKGTWEQLATAPDMFVPPTPPSSL